MPGSRIAVLRAAVVALLLLAGCAGMDSKPRDTPARPMREGIRAFSLEGRVAVRRGNENHAAAIEWMHIGARDELFVTAPTGQGIAALVGDASGARLETADKQRHTATDVEALSERVFGTRLPLRDLPAWVVGQPSAAATRIERDSIQRPKRLFEQGWQIDYLSYESERGDALPTLLHLQSGDIEVRLKIDAWMLAQ
jgi:outer membrane lipoprotein LolB